MFSQTDIKEIEKLIEKDLVKELELIKKELYFFIDKGFDMYYLKNFMKHYPIRILKEKAEILLDTLLNYLMEKVLREVKKYPKEIQYFIFKSNLRENIRNWALSDSEKFKPSFLRIKEEETVFEKTLNVAPGLAVSIGGLLVVASAPETFILKAVPGVSSLLGPLYIYKKLKEKDHRLKKVWRKQINNYLKNIQEDLKKWLIHTIEKFLSEVKNLQLQIENNPEFKRSYSLNF